MLKEIRKAVEALQQVPVEYRALVLQEAGGGRRRGRPAGRRGRKPGPKPGSRKPGPKPGPKPSQKASPAKRKPAVKSDSGAGPVKVSSAKAEKLARLRASASASTE